jgi:hypothetical protein
MNEPARSKGLLYPVLWQHAATCLGLAILISARLVSSGFSVRVHILASGATEAV